MARLQCRKWLESLTHQNFLSLRKIAGLAKFCIGLRASFLPINCLMMAVVPEFSPLRIVALDGGSVAYMQLCMGYRTENRQMFSVIPVGSNLEVMPRLGAFGNLIRRLRQVAT